MEPGLEKVGREHRSGVLAQDPLSSETLTFRDWGGQAGEKLWGLAYECFQFYRRITKVTK